ncbi:hypothetical protein E4U42_006216 [Claviceps africana]|uniref:RRM domain-containing protein n=1 Tax=Claviceps africana TaxID=83212 RepID=A0A8K0J4R1_9HYPO|nr:hypothetical protein E4U42_006216 [Claviceps africana]
MAPILRKRKSISDAQKSNGATKAADKPAQKDKGKRKGKNCAQYMKNAPPAEDASPVSIKKQKPTKKTAASPKAAEKPTKDVKSSKAVEKKEAQKEEARDEEEEDDKNESVLQMDVESDDSDGEDNENVKNLAADVDSEDEAPVDETLSYKPGQSVGKAPIVSKELVKLAKAPTGEPGVVYIGRIPHGFYEHQMRQYLSQFGPVTRVRMSRNKKTGASKHFAFVEFEESSTAEIVAKTMDNYLLFGHILKCKIIPKAQVHEKLFQGANRRFKAIPWNKMAGLKLKKPRSQSVWEARVSKEQSKRARQAAKLKEMGYEFEAPDLKDVPTPQPAAAATENSGEESVKAVDAAPAEKEKEAAETETPAASEKSKTKAIEAKPESVPVLESKIGKAVKGRGKKVKA